MKTRLRLLILLMLPFTIAEAQKSIQDSIISTNLVYASYTLQFPGGDMAERFGINSGIGPGYMLKTSKNWVFGFEGSFLFGKQVKNTQNILSLIETSDGNIIDMEGIYADYNFNERGFSAILRVGKLIPVWGPNRNSGILFTLGGGYLQHRIYIEHKDKTAPAISGEYLKGYDELKDGFASNIFLGYLYMGNNNKVNFFAGIDVTAGFTSHVRPYSFNNMTFNTGSYNDILTGIRVGWIIPVFSRAPKEYYYY
ncbi:MAG: hypothetical protein IPN08_11270 [Bacteroidales bacterium]|nr:hypothetical protein [Bacteroidales bacterium]MBK9357954.1 hypothetical protein [Bacteroidales bacterium]